MQDHIISNFKYPKEAEEKGIQGKVNVLFIIAKDGSITNLNLKGPHKTLEGEAERIIRLLPKMKPGEYQGKKVDVAFSLPITFKL